MALLGAFKIAVCIVTDLVATPGAPRSGELLLLPLVGVGERLLLPHVVAVELRGEER